MTVAAGETWYITDESASISIGSTTLTITFKPHDCSIPGSHVVYIRVFRNGAIDGDSTVYVKELYQVTKNITVTAALSGDVYLELYRDWETDRKSTRLNSSHSAKSRMPSSA